MLVKLKYLVLIMASASAASVASAREYIPLARCENGSVVLDQVIEDDRRYNHYQVVVHGRQFVEKVNQTLAGQALIYDDGNIGVFRVDEYKTDSSFSDRSSFRTASTVYSFQDTLTLHKTYAIEGRFYGGNYVFRGCKKEQ